MSPTLGTTAGTTAASPAPGTSAGTTTGPPPATTTAPTTSPRSTEPAPGTTPPPSGGPRVYLTFDDGPTTAWTPQILDTLERYGAHATFFSVGQNVAGNPSLTAREIRDGDHVGDHTWDHADLTKLNRAAIQSEIIRASDAIVAAGGVVPDRMRPPYGATNSTVADIAGQDGMMVTLWSIDTNDWRLPGTPAIVAAVLNGVGDGSIVLMHDGGGVTRQQTVDAVRQLVPALQQRGYELDAL